MTEVNGIEFGFRSGDLTLYPNLWLGSYNNGEIGVTGTSITKIDGTILSIGTINYGVACNDAKTDDGYVMYSVENVHTRFSSSPPIVENADHLVFVTYSGGQWYYDNNTSDVAFTPVSTDLLVAEVTRGIKKVITYGEKIVAIFAASGTFTPLYPTNAEVLVVAGGGAGTGYGGGGGGAGGVIYNSSFAISLADHSVTVGAGGTASATNTAQCNPGENSVFSTLTAIGGGVTVFHGVGGAGGSGAGGMYVTSGNVPLSGGAGTPGQGNNGGTGGGKYVNYVIGGGGGGKGGVGGNAVYNGSAGGNGGVGQAYSISGSSRYYAGGGGGGGTTTGGTGGNGGGGNGGSSNVNGTAATPNTGGGGGGGGWNAGVGGNGGSGIVIISYDAIFATDNYLKRYRRTRLQGAVTDY